MIAMVVGENLSPSSASHNGDRYLSFPIIIIFFFPLPILR